MPSFAQLPAVATSLTRAADHLAGRGAEAGCGCPAWAAAADPEAAPVAHRAGCPMRSVDAVFASFNLVGPVIQSAVDAGGPAGVVWARAERALGFVEDRFLASAAVAWALALAGVARLRVQARAAAQARSHDLYSREVEKYAVLTEVTESTAVPLTAETAVRLLLSPTPALDLDRLVTLLADAGGRSPRLEDLALPPLIVALAAAVNQVALDLRTGHDDVALFDMAQLASEGFNLLVGIRSVVELAAAVPAPAAGPDLPAPRIPES